MGEGLRHAEQVMGTVVSFDVRDAGEGERRAEVEAALRRAVDSLHRADRVFSTYRQDSQVSRLRRGELTPAECDPEVAEVLALGAAAEQASGGAFSVYPDGELDPSGVVKGWAVERASDILRAAGSLRHSVNGGGDIQTAGEPEPGREWSVGIAHPLHPGAYATVVRGRGIAVATSGSAERGAHLLDPRTGRPASGGLASVTVLGRSLTDVDIAATTVYVLGSAAGRRWLEQREDFEGFAVLADGRAWWTPGFAEHAQLPDAG